MHATTPRCAQVCPNPRQAAEQEECRKTGRFQTKYGFWWPVVERSVAAFLKCADLHAGFARVRCPDCQHPLFLVRRSCSRATDC